MNSSTTPIHYPTPPRALADGEYYGYFSREQGLAHGSHVYATPNGEEVEVSNVANRLMDAAYFADTIFVGIVTRHVRANRKMTKSPKVYPVPESIADLVELSKAMKAYMATHPYDEITFLKSGSFGQEPAPLDDPRWPKSSNL